jgi:hypothetical protein
MKGGIAIAETSIPELGPHLRRDRALRALPRVALPRDGGRGQAPENPWREVGLGLPGLTYLGLERQLHARFPAAHGRPWQPRLGDLLGFRLGVLE